jgi:hypothetical protein
MVAKRLATVNVRDMQLDDRNVRALDRVVKGDRGMRVRACIENDAYRLARVMIAASLVYPVDELSFVVGLPAVDGDAELRALLAAQRLDIRQRVLPVYGGLTRSEQIETLRRARSRRANGSVVDKRHGAQTIGRGKRRTGVLLCDRCARRTSHIDTNTVLLLVVWAINAHLSDYRTNYERSERRRSRAIIERKGTTNRTLIER